MMDALINTFVEDLRKRATQYPDDLEGHMLDHASEIDGSFDYDSKKYQKAST